MDWMNAMALGFVLGGAFVWLVYPWLRRNTEVHIYNSPSQPRVEETRGRIDIHFDDALAQVLSRNSRRKPSGV